MKLHHGEEGKVVCMSSCSQKQRLSEWDTEWLLCYTPSFFLYPSPWWVWTGWDITTTNNETVICEYLSWQSLVSYSIAVTWAIHPSWYLASPTPQLPLYFSTSHFPPVPHHDLQSPPTPLKPVSSTPALCCRWLKLCQAQNLLEEHKPSDCMVCIQLSLVQEDGWLWLTW